MKPVMTKIAVALAFTLCAASSQAAVVGPTNMQITAGLFEMGAFTSGSSIPFELFGGNDITDQYNLPGWNTAVAQPSGVLALGATMSMQFGTGTSDQMNYYFAPSVPGAFGGGSVPIFNGSLVNGNVSSIDMRALF